METKGAKNLREVHNNFSGQQKQDKSKSHSSKSSFRQSHYNDESVDTPAVIISVDRAAELVAKLQSLEDRQDMLDLFLKIFKFTSPRDIERFISQCRMTPERPKVECRSCQDCKEQHYGQAATKYINRLVKSA